MRELGPESARRLLVPLLERWIDDRGAVRLFELALSELQELLDKRQRAVVEPAL